MLSLADLELFVRTVEQGSLSRAARGLDVLPATASASLKRLEHRLDARLLVRSTRSLRLTPAGEALLEPARRALQAARDVEEAVAATRGRLSGTVTISAPSDFGRGTLRGWLDAFQRRHAGVRLTLLMSDRIADFYRERVDLALRYGVLEDSSLVTRGFAPRNRRVLCASPEYVARHGAPVVPDDLRDHACVAWMIATGPSEVRVHDDWRFTRGRETSRVRVQPVRTSDDGAVVHDWALAGAGVAYKSWIDIADDVRAGRLVTLLDDWEGEASPMQLVLAHRDRTTPLLRSAIEYLAECGAALPDPPMPRR